MSTYPSGAPMPQYGPSNDDEFITDGLEWAFEALLHRDEMNAAMHCTPVRLSPVTKAVQVALGLHRSRLAPGPVGQTKRDEDEIEASLADDRNDDAWLEDRGLL